MGDKLEPVDPLVALAKLKAERDEARALVFDLFAQGCQQSTDKRSGEYVYDHCCISTYEDAQAALISWGMVKREECVRE